jgi:hypothetical protein
MRDTHVIDVGCGDARFWAWKQKPKTYAGVDISATALTRAMRVLPMARVYNVSSAEFIPDLTPVPVVLCLDLIFHLMDRDTVEATLTNLTRYSTDFIFIYTWVKDPSPYDETFQKYWDMDDFKRIFSDGGFNLHHLARSKHDRIGGMYVYRKAEAC